MTEGMTVAVRERALGCGTHVGEDEGRRGLARETLEVDTIPGRDGGGEDARFGA